MTPSDLDLLEQYTRQNSEAAFATLVDRHLNLVYSAAVRQVRAPQLAEEIAQSVFTDLARAAGKLKPHTILTAWLYEVTRHTAIDVVRREARRQLREQIATEMNAMNANATDWTHIEPLLDEAMHALDDTDRTAVLLRYFENKSLREVGFALGTSDDTAQKRVSRAVERLREYFAKRGVSVGAGGLVVVISANAVQAAPAGLAVAISSAVTAATLTIATHTTMHWLNLKSVAAILAAAIATGTGTFLVQQREVNLLRTENQSLTVQQKQMTTERGAALIAASQKTAEVDKNRKEKEELLRLRGEVGVLRRQIAESELLRKTITQTSAGITAVQNPVPIENQTGLYIQVMTNTINGMKLICLAIRIYASDHNDQFPTTFDQITNNLPSKLGDSNMDLDTFEFVAHASPVNNRTHPDKIIARERIARQTPEGKWARVYGFTDGHVIEQIADDGNFEAWEKQHVVRTP